MFFLKKKPKGPRPKVPKKAPCAHEYQVVDVRLEDYMYDYTDTIHMYDLVCSKCNESKTVGEGNLAVLTQHFNVKDGKGNLL